jgi:cellulose synthase operon protein C
MRIIIKWRFLLKLSVVLITVGLTIHFAHRWQARKQVGVFLHQADISRDAAAQEQEAGEFQKAAAERDREQGYLQRYLMARPDDLDIRDRLARLMCQTAKSGRELLAAFFVLEDVLRRDPSRDDLQQFTIDFAMAPQHGLYKEALGHLETLIQNRPDDRELVVLIARCYVGAKEYENAAKKYEEARATYEKAGVFKLTDQSIAELQGENVPETVLSKLPSLKNKEFSRVDFTGEIGKVLKTDEMKQFQSLILRHAKKTTEKIDTSDKRRSDPVDPYAGLALVLRQQLNKASDADKIIEKMLDENEQNFRAHLVAANYWREFDKPDRAEPRIKRALQLAPKELEVLLAAAEVERTRTRRLARERSWLAAAIALQTAKSYLTRAVELYSKATGAYLAMASFEAELRHVSDAMAVIRKGLEAIPNSPDLLFGLMEYQFRAGDAAGATETVEKLHDRGLQPELVEYERARVLLLKEEWLEAAKALEDIIPKLQQNPRLYREANLYLGRCYEQIGENDRRVIAFNRALPLTATDPLWLTAMSSIAETQIALGQSAEALKTYRQIKDWAVGAWISVARLEMIFALQAPEGKADWTATEEAVLMAKKAIAENLIPDSSELKLLEARLKFFRGKQTEARKLLEELRAQRPKESAVWIELAMQDVRENNPQKAIATLAVGEKEIGDSLEFRLVRAELWVRVKEPELATKIASLAAGREKFSLPQQRRLLRGLADLATAAGADAVADQLWEDLARAKPFDLTVHLTLFDRATRTGNVGAMEQSLNKIREIDGENGQTTRLTRAILLIHRSQTPNDPALRDEALALLNGLEREHVEGTLAGKVALGQGLIFDLNLNPNAALEKYRQAITLGEPNPQALRRVMELLSQKRLFTDAMAIFEKLPGSTASGADVQRLAAELSFQTDKWEEAIKHAEKAVPETSTKYQDQIWLGRMYWSTGDHKKPEAMFREATRLAPDAMDSWLILMQYLISTGKKDEAAKVFEQAKDKVKKTERSIFLAQAYVQLEQPDKALDAYKQSRTDNPNDVRILMAEAEYLLQLGRLADAREGYQRVIALPLATASDKAVARQRLALAFAADPDYATSRTAIELLGGDALAPSSAETPGQRRSRAVILALQKERASKLEAIRLLEENHEGRTPNEKFLLAQLYNAVGNKKQVRVVMKGLLESDKNRLPLYLTFFAAWLIREGDFQDAEEWVKHLIKKDPESLPTAELKARLAAAKKDLAGARAALLSKADAPGAPIGLIARVCEELSLYPEAERLLKKFVEQNQEKEPRVVLALAAYYGRRGQTADALRICEESWTRLPVPAVGEVAIRVLYNASAPSAGDMTKVSGWLQEASGKSQGKEQAALIQQLASVRNLQGDYVDSASMYRKALEANPRDVLAMNNLAYLLSAREKQHDEALKLIDQAKRIIGEHTSLLGTEAMIWLNKSEPEKAFKLLEVVIAEAPSGTVYFQLAQVELAAKHEFEAKIAWRRALELGLHVGDLHPLERSEFERIAAKFK